MKPSQISLRKTWDHINLQTIERYTSDREKYFSV